MARIRLDEFVRQLVDSGLMTVGEVSSLQQSLGPAQQAADADSLAQELVQRGKLTRFQAAAACQGKIRSLVFGEYVILDKLGQGGMGVVLKARHRRMDRFVAIKMLSPDATKSPQAVERFYREVKAAARLSHPHIVAAYDASEHQGRHYLVMEYVEGKDLARIVKECGPLPVEQATDYILQAARGLQCAHEQGIVHRDIKPGNLLLDHKGTVKILDMGLARLEQPDTPEAEMPERLTTTGQVMGTWDYMAPEQSLDTHSADHRADIYSLGCTLYRLLTGKPPYAGATYAKLFLAHMSAPIPSLCQERPGVSAELDAVFQKMLAKKPEDRYQSMQEVIVDLESCLGSGFTSGGALASREDSTALRENLSFLQQPGSQVTSTRPKTETTDEDTRDLGVERDTGAGGPALPAATAIRHSPPAALPAAVREEAVAPTPPARRRRTVVVALGLLGVVAVSAIAFQIVVRIKKGDKETVVNAPLGSKVEITPEGQVEVTVSPPPKVAGQDSPQAAAGSPAGKEAARAIPPPVRPGTAAPPPGPAKPKVKIAADRAAGEFKPRQALSKMALVSSPATISGLQSWTVESAACRGGVTGVSYRPDGQVLTTSSRDGVIRHWDLRSGKCQSILLGHDQVVNSVSWSRDGKWLASTCEMDGERLWGLDAATAVRKLAPGPQSKGGSGAEWSPSGRFLAVGNRSGQLTLWDTTTSRRPLLTQAHTGPLLNLSWSADDTQLASVGVDGVVKIWSVPTLSPGREIRIAQGGRSCVAWSPDGRLLATSTQPQPNAVQLWDPASGEPRGRLDLPAHPRGGAWLLAWSSGGQLAAVQERGPAAQVCLWSKPAGAAERTFSVPVEQPCTPCWSPDSKSIALGSMSKGAVVLCDAASGRTTILGRPFSWAPGGVRFSHDGRRLAYRDNNGSIAVWTLLSGELPKRLGAPGADRGATLDWSQDGRLLEKHAGETVEVWDPSTAQAIVRFVAPGSDDQAAISPDGKLVATGGRNVAVWQVPSGGPLLSKNLPAVCLAFAPDGKSLAVGLASNSVALLDAHSGATLKELPLPAPATHLAWSPQASRLATADTQENGDVLLWNVASGAIVQRLSQKGHGSVKGMRWLPDGTTLLIRNGCLHAVLWDTESGRRQQEPFFVCEGATVDIAPDGQMIANRVGGLLRLERPRDASAYGTIISLPSGPLAVCAAGHYIGSPQAEEDLFYVAQTKAGQETWTPEEFQKRYGWKNDPSQCKFVDESEVRGATAP